MCGVLSQAGPQIKNMSRNTPPPKRPTADIETECVEALIAQTPGLSEKQIIQIRADAGLAIGIGKQSHTELMEDLRNLVARVSEHPEKYIPPNANK